MTRTFSMFNHCSPIIKFLAPFKYLGSHHRFHTILMFGGAYGNARMPNWPHRHQTPLPGIATTDLRRDKWGASIPYACWIRLFISIDDFPRHTQKSIAACCFIISSVFAFFGHFFLYYIHYMGKSNNFFVTPLSNLNKQHYHLSFSTDKIKVNPSSHPGC